MKEIFHGPCPRTVPNRPMLRSFPGRGGRGNQSPYPPENCVKHTGSRLGLRGAYGGIMYVHAVYFGLQLGREDGSIDAAGTFIANGMLFVVPAPSDFKKACQGNVLLAFPLGVVGRSANSQR